MTERKLCERLVSQAQSTKLSSPRHPLSVYQKSENQNLSADDYYDLLHDKVNALYPEGIDDKKCHEATRNFIGFGKLLLEMKRRRSVTQNDE